MRGALTVALWTLLVLAPACTPAPPGNDDSQPGVGEPRAELRERQMELGETAGGLLLRTNAVDRAKVLAALARAYAFEVDDQTGDEAALTLTLHDATLADALAVVLAGTSHRLEYRAAGANSRLVRVVVGDVEDYADRSDDDSESDERHRQAKRGKNGSRRVGKARSGDDKPNQAAARAKRRARERAERKAATLRKLPELPPAERAEALWQLDTDDAAHLDYLLGQLRDTDPRVRTAAVEALWSTRDPRAHDGLLAALDDADTRVVLAAIEALETRADVRTLAALRRLDSHPDPNVRVAASTALGGR